MILISFPPCATPLEVGWDENQVICLHIQLLRLSLGVELSHTTFPQASVLFGKSETLKEIGMPPAGAVPPCPAPLEHCSTVSGSASTHSPRIQESVKQLLHYDWCLAATLHLLRLLQKPIHTPAANHSQIIWNTKCPSPSSLCTDYINFISPWTVTSYFYFYKVVLSTCQIQKINTCWLMPSCAVLPLSCSFI